MKELVCEMCGSKDLVKQDGVFVCQSCGCKYSVEEAKKMMVEGTVVVDNTHMIDNYLTLAVNAYDSDNKKEAEEYCNKIIEIAPENYKAWVLKGKAAGWQSTLARPRIDECVSAFIKGVEFCPEDEKENVGKDVKDELVNLSMALINARADSFIRFPDESTADGFTKDVSIIIKAIMKFLASSKIMVPPEETLAPIAERINVAVVSAWKKVIEPEYLGDENKPDKYDFQKYIKRIDCCINLLEFTVSLYDGDDKNDITCYDNIVFFHEKAIDAKAYDYEFVGSVQRWFVSTTLSDAAIKFRKDRIEEINTIKYKLNEKVKKEERDAAKEDSEDKDCNELLELAMSDIRNGQYAAADARFDSIIEKDPELACAYIGKAVAMSHVNIINCKAACRKVIKANELTADKQYEAYVDELLNTPTGFLGFSLLGVSCAFGLWDEFLVLLEMGSDIEFKDPQYNTTALYNLCCKELDPENADIKRKMAAKLIEMGADVTVKNKGGVALFNQKTDPEIVKLIKAKYPNMTVQVPASSGGCYVATAVYGSYDCPEVWTLRRFRDNTLAETWYGRAFIHTYYAISPTLVKMFGHTKWFKNMWKGKLDNLVLKLQSEGVESTPYEDKEW